MAHIRTRTGYATIIRLLGIICGLLLTYRDYQATIQNEAAMNAWDGLFTACELFKELVADPRTISEA